MNYKSFVIFFICLLALPVQALEKMGKLDKLVLAGPYSNISYPLIHMMETGALDDIAQSTAFVALNNPDQARLMALGKGQDQAHFMAMPTNVAANLYNKGVSLKLMNVPVWGILWMVSRDPSMKTLADFKGEKIAVPYREDMPDIVFRQLAEAEGLDVKKDLTLHYMSHPLDAMQLLLSGQVKHALLAEPAISMVLNKNQKLQKKKGASPLYRSVDLQQVWGKAFKRQARIPQLSMTATAAILDNPKVQKRFQEEYAKSTEWCLNNPKQAGKMLAKHLNRLTPKAIADSLKSVNMQAVDAQAAKPELEFFYRQLMADKPALVGNRLPDHNLYFGH